MKNEKKEKINIELYHLSKGFKALTIDHKKGVLKTAQGLLKIQRTHKAMTVNDAHYNNFSFKGKNG
jgi:hypothetical protein